MPERIIFMGTPDFAVESLKKLHQSGYEVSAVVTAPDRPSGRGRKINSSPVKNYASSHNIPVLQPTNLKDPAFVGSLKTIQADIFVVVAFRMLPKVVWEVPPLGTINLHASLLPQYRGAAPVNWAIINGEKETGVTTFLIDDKIDTGNIILQDKIDIEDDITAGQLHDILMVKGAELVVRTVEILSAGNTEFISQSELINNKNELKTAPKISKDDCRIEWNRSTREVYNFIRGLSPYPGAWTMFETDTQKQLTAKIIEADIFDHQDRNEAGAVSMDEEPGLIIKTRDGALRITKIQPEGKRPMNSTDFIRGFRERLVRAV